MAQRARKCRQLVSRLMGLGTLLVLISVAYYSYGFNLSGRLALSQAVPSTEVSKGFDFGPVWLEQGHPARYFINAQVPETEGAPWYTSFEILDATKSPVSRQDEVRYIGDQQFAPGEFARQNGAFTLSRDTGYYYFRFKANTGEYPASVSGPPALSLCIRQGVLTGYALWVPPTAAALLGLLLICVALSQVSALGRQDLPRSQVQPDWQPQQSNY